MLSAAQISSRVELSGASVYASSQLHSGDGGFDGPINRRDPCSRRGG
jgi:hypothetical protein